MVYMMSAAALQLERLRLREAICAEPPGSRRGKWLGCFRHQAAVSQPPYPPPNFRGKGVG